MKRLFSLIMVMMLVLSLTVTGYAATPGTGSITITNATIDETYEVYKIFDATYDVSNPDAVAYTVVKGSAVYNEMFDADGNPLIDNTYFTYTNYDGTYGAVNRIQSTSDASIITYLTGMMKELIKDGSIAPADSATADATEVVFDDLPYGYYLINKAGDADAAVTINSATPDVEVVDKNQIPAGGDSFKKLVFDENTGEWVSDTSANVGDILDFKIEFDATNYNGENQIKYYTIEDTKGNALWAEFEDIKVTLMQPQEDEDGNVTYTTHKELTKGYYHYGGGDENSAADTGEWALIGTGWSAADEAAEEAAAGTMKDKAEWYLIHRGFDKFEIVIPWMSDHTFNGTYTGFGLRFGEDADSMYPSPVKVVIEYSASVEPNVVVGDVANNGLQNSAKLTWTDVRTDGPSESEDTTAQTYGLGIFKTDAATDNALANAVFGLYSDEDCENPVYVIPTDVAGVYILDDLNTDVSGEKRESARDKYKDYLAGYLGNDYETTKAQKNEVTTLANGKVAILGLEEGTYYLREIQAPSGYNALPGPVEVAVGEGLNNSFFVITDTNGNAVDQETESNTGDKKYTYSVAVVPVENSTGVELPSTGGEGTMMLITIGTIVAVAFAVLLITHKKMTVYHD